MFLTRRRLLIYGAATVAVGSVAALYKMQINSAETRSESNQFFRFLPIPELWDARKLNNTIQLIAQEGIAEIVPGVNVPTLGYSSPVLGPTIRIQSGDTINVKVTNALDSDTTVHWHGLFVPSEIDGGPYNLIKPGGSWEPSLHITQPASTAWYHPHPYGDAGRQVYLGLAGMIYVEDAASLQFGLPGRYGVDDLPIILQDRFFNDDGDLLYDDTPDGFRHGMRGNTVTVNGIYGPVAELPMGLIRLRFLNAANARNFRLSFDDGRLMHVIAGDNGFLSTSTAISTLTIAPGERYEVLVDFSDGRSTALLAYTDHNGRPSTLLTDELNQVLSSASDILRPVMRFDPVETISAVKYQMPVKLVELESAITNSEMRRRTFILDSMTLRNQQLYGQTEKQGGSTQSSGETQTEAAAKTALFLGLQMGVNGRTFDPTRIDAEVKLGSTEIWDLRGTEMAHPFHIHGASFRIMNLDGASTPAHQSGPKDTVLVNEWAQILVSFNQPTTIEKPFVFHCHILEHEDAGMMGQYLAS